MTKLCTKCKQHKSLDCFSKQKDKKTGFKSNCKDCTQSYNKNNKERIAIHDKIYYELNIDTILENKKQYYLENKEKIIENKCLYEKENSEKIKENKKTYYHKNKKDFLSRNAKRRADKIQATPSWLTKEQLEEIKNIYKTCPKGYHVDHIIPLKGKTVCGLHVPWNLQHLPAKENLQKNNKIIEEYKLKLTPTEEPEDI